MLLNGFLRVFVILCLLHLSDSKPPKNLNRMRNRGGGGGLGTKNIDIGSLQNSGQKLAVYEEDKEKDSDSATPTTSIELLEEEEKDKEKDDLEALLDDDFLAEPEGEPEVTSKDNEPEEIVVEKKEEKRTEKPEEVTTIQVITVPTPVVEEVAKISDTEIMKDLLTSGYDWRVRPPGTNSSILGGGAVIVFVNMLIRSISKIDNVNMEYSTQLTFRESWVDKRLAYGEKGMGETVPDFVILAAGQQIWMPDSFFQNEKQAHRHMIDKPNVLIRVHKDGLILYSVRISLVLSCPMHLQYYPMDIQTCLIDLASYAYTTNDIEYRWKEQQPVQLKDGLNSSLPSFELSNVSTAFCHSHTNTGTYSCLRTIMRLKRQFSYYLLQLYIPSTMLVIVSWVSFWLDRSAVPARVTLGVTTLLTMTTQSSGINSKLPPVAYIKAIDVWIGACMTFIFGALLEFAFVTYLGSRLEAKKRSRLAKTKQPLLAAPQPTEVWIPRSVAELGNNDLSKNGNNRKDPPVKRNPLSSLWKATLGDCDNPKRADLISRVIFPILFIAFNVLYWSHYGKYQSNDVK
ncbi:unnamed protein product, partial [Mesorhabditis belari]|uniref:Uncharacterized protein n=1 Tax=Mesorhabditis belari TaxID=2138241 RepID=A0AAF3FCQ5_9BILA